MADMLQRPGKAFYLFYVSSRIYEGRHHVHTRYEGHELLCRAGERGGMALAFAGSALAVWIVWGRLLAIV